VGGIICARYAVDMAIGRQEAQFDQMYCGVFGWPVLSNFAGESVHAHVVCPTTTLHKELITPLVYCAWYLVLSRYRVVQYFGFY